MPSGQPSLILTHHASAINYAITAWFAGSRHVPLSERVVFMLHLRQSQALLLPPFHLKQMCQVPASLHPQLLSSTSPPRQLFAPSPASPSASLVQRLHSLPADVCQPHLDFMAEIKSSSNMQMYRCSSAVLLSVCLLDRHVSGLCNRHLAFKLLVMFRPVAVFQRLSKLKKRSADILLERAPSSQCISIQENSSTAPSVVCPGVNARKMSNT